MFKSTKLRSLLNERFRNTIFFITIFIVVLILSLSYYSNKIVKELTSSAIETTYKEGSTIIDTKLSTYINLVEALSNNREFKQQYYQAADKIPAIITYITGKDAPNIGVISSSGVIYLCDGTIFEISENKELYSLVNTKEDFVKLVLDSIDNSYYIAIGSPIFKENNEIEYIIEFLPVEKIFAPVHSLNKTNDDSLLLIDEDYNIIASETKSTSAENIIEVIKEKNNTILSLTTSNNLTLSLDNGYVGIKYLDDMNLYLIVYSPTDKVLEMTSKTILLLFAFIVLAILVILFLIFYYKKMKLLLNKTKDSNDSVVNVTNLMTLSFDRTGKLKSINEFVEKKLSYTCNELLDNYNIKDITDSSCHKTLNSLLKATDSKEKSLNYELTFLDSFGKKLYANFTISEISNTFYSYENIIEIIGIDITESVQAAKELENKHNELKNVYTKLEHSKKQLELQYKKVEESRALLAQAAYYDSVTGLPTRTKLDLIFIEHLKVHPKENFYTFFIDIDNFKFINDALGHSAGDLFLKEVAVILNNVLDNNYYLSRNGADEFILLLWNKTPNDISYIATQMVDTFKQPVKLNDYLINSGISIGIAQYPTHGTSLNDVIKCADRAMHNSKMLGRSRFTLFNNEMKAELDSCILIQNNLKTALENEEFELYYQPKYQTSKNKIVGFEALIRWNSPELGFVNPSSFIQIAERSNIIVDIGNWVLCEACSFINKLQSMGINNISIAVNLSVVQIVQDDFVNNVIKIAKKYNINPKLLELELTETLLLTSLNNTIRKMQQLRNYGFKVALDDFGTGYSSLSYLSELPIDTLKIDKSFVDSLESNTTKLNIIDSIVSLSKKLNYSIVAEGVENPEQVDILKKMNCDIIQGFVYSPAITQVEATKLLIKE